MKFPKVHLILCLMLFGACSKENYKPKEDNPGAVNPAAQEHHWNTDTDRGGATTPPDQIAMREEVWPKLLSASKFDSGAG